MSEDLLWYEYFFEQVVYTLPRSQTFCSNFLRKLPKELNIQMVSMGAKSIFFMFLLHICIKSQ